MMETPAKAPPYGPCDLDLVLEAKAGNSAAFESLVRRYSGMVFALAYARLADRDSAEDLAQEVFVRAYSKIGALSEPRYFVSWLGRITRNLAEDWARSGQRRSRAIAMLSINEAGMQIHDPRCGDTREQLDADQRTTQLGTALKRLSPSEREIVLLHYAEEWSLTDIAKKLNLHRTTVGRRLDGALTRMRMELTPLLREQCKPMRAPAQLGARSAAALSAFIALPEAPRAKLIASLSTKAQTTGKTTFAGAQTASKLSAALKLAGAAGAAGGKVVMAKSAVVGVTAIAVIAGAGWYTHSKLATPDFHSSAVGSHAVADQALFNKTYPPGTINITSSKSPANSTSIHSTTDTFMATGLNVQSAIVNVFHDFQRSQVILGATMPTERKDVVITAPAGHPEQLQDVLRTEIPKAFGVTIHEEERDLNVLVLTAPQGDSRLEKGSGASRTNTTNGTLKFDNSPMMSITRTLGGNAGIPVVDETGLTGMYNANLSVARGDRNGLIKAVHDTMGLDLKPATRNMKVLVVERS